MFIYELLNGLIGFKELIYLIGFNITNHCLRKNNLFHVSFYKNNYTSSSFFPKSLNLWLTP